MICTFGDRIFAKVTIVGLDAIIIKTKFKILDIFTHITHKFELWSFEVCHCVIPLLTPSLDKKTVLSNRTILYSLRNPTWRTTTTCSQPSYGRQNSSILCVFWARRGLQANHGTVQKSAIFPQPGNQKRFK